MSGTLQSDAVAFRNLTSDDFCSAAGHATVTSPRREMNQDRMLIDPSGNLFVIADGMGGMRAGECASQMAVNRLAEWLRPSCGSEDPDQLVTRTIRQAFLDTNHAILRAGDADPERHGMGTTATVAVRLGERLFISSLGDSRAYLLRGGCLWQYTVDHTMAEALVSTGVISPSEACRHPWRHRLWKHLGCRSLADGPEVSLIRLRPGDRLLLATDGVTGVLDCHGMTRILSSDRTPSQVARMLVQAAVACESQDDATCIVSYF